MREIGRFTRWLVREKRDWVCIIKRDKVKRRKELEKNRLQYILVTDYILHRESA